MENLVALEWSRGSAAEKHFKMYVNEGKLEEVKMMKEVLKHKFGSSIFDRLVKESDATIKKWQMHIIHNDDFKKEFQCFEKITKFKEESDGLCQDAFDRFIKELQQYVNEDIDEFKQSGTTSST